MREDHLVGLFIRLRRQQPHLTSNEAAELAVLPFSKWAAMESGWRPDLPDNLVFTIAGALEVSADLIRLWSASS